MSMCESILTIALVCTVKYLHYCDYYYTLGNDSQSTPKLIAYLTQTQIFETVWNMDSDSCHASVVNVIYNLRKKIEPDSKNPTYIKTVLGVGYKFSG